MSKPPVLSRLDADALASAIIPILIGCGCAVQMFNVTETPQGLRFLATLDGHTVAVVVPPGHTADYHGLALELVRSRHTARDLSRYLPPH